MIKPDMIPDKVVEAAAKAAHDLWRKQASVGDDICEYPQWDDVSRFHKDDLRGQARTSIAAALNAWPQMHLHEWQRPWLGGMSGTDIILPMPEEAGDETVP